MCEPFCQYKHEAPASGSPAPPIHSLALRATNGQNLRKPRRFYYAAKSAGCLTLAFCVTSTKQRRTEPNVGGDRPRQPAVDGGSRTLGRAPRWGANVAWGSLPRVRCATLGYDVQPRCGCREGHCQILELGTWNLEPGTSTWVDGRSQRRACITRLEAYDASYVRTSSWTTRPSRFVSRTSRPR